MSSKIQDLTATTSASASDVFPLVVDPSGTPLDRKITLDNLKTSLGVTTYTDEQAQDAVGTILTDSNTVDFTYNDATPSITGDVKTQMSLTSDASGIKLSGDSSTPGNSKYYGTDSGGTKGFFDLPSSGSSTPKMFWSTLFETSTRFGGGNSGTGSARTFDSNGLNLSTGNSALGYAYNYMTFPGLGFATTEIGSPEVSTHMYIDPGTALWAFFGMGNMNDIGTGTGDGYTGKHIGFKITRAGSGSITLYATVADGTTETATSMGTLTAGTYVDLIFKVNGTSSVDFYYREAGGALSSATNIATVPTGGNGDVFHYIKNKTITSNSTLYIESMSYSR